MTDIFANRSFSDKHIKAAREFKKQIDGIDSIERLQRIREKLGAVCKSFGKNAGYATITLFVVKHRLKELGKETVAKRALKHTHRMTDHAFVQYLRRAHGLDIESMKDRAIEQNERHNLVKLYEVDGKIITVFEE